MERRRALSPLFVSVYSVCTVLVCVPRYSVCTLCAAKPHRHRPELLVLEFVSSSACSPTNYALIMHWLCTDFNILICYLLTVSNSKTTNFSKLAHEADRPDYALIIHWLYYSTAVICRLTVVRNTYVYTCWCVYSVYSVQCVQCVQCTHGGMCAAARGPRARRVRQ
jgi:hypothetical protein